MNGRRHGAEPAYGPNPPAPTRRTQEDERLYGRRPGQVDRGRTQERYQPQERVRPRESDWPQERGRPVNRPPARLDRPEPVAPRNVRERESTGPQDAARAFFGLASVVWIGTGIGFCLDAAAIAESSKSNSALGEGLFWVSIVGPFLVMMAVLLGGRPSRRLRRVTVALIGVYPTLLYRLTSPLVLNNYDEHLHERALTDLLHGSGLFAPNPM